MNIFYSPRMVAEIKEGKNTSQVKSSQVKSSQVAFNEPMSIAQVLQKIYTVYEARHIKIT